MSHRLNLLRRIALLRESEHHAAMRAAAQAEQSRSDLALLSERTLRLVQDYAARCGTTDGATLSLRVRFAGTLRSVHENACADGARACADADAKLALVAEVARRRDAVRERIEEEHRAGAREGAAALAAAGGAMRRRSGTILKDDRS